MIQLTDYTSSGSYIEEIIEGLEQHQVHLDFEVPFLRDSLDTAKTMACWLTGENTATFSVVGLFSTSRFAHMLKETFGHGLARDVRLLLNLTSHLFIDGKLVRFGNLGAEDIQLVRDYVGDRVMATFEKLLKPQELKKRLTEAEKPHVWFLLVFSVAVALRYTIETVRKKPWSNVTPILLIYRRTCLMRPTVSLIMVLMAPSSD